MSTFAVTIETIAAVAPHPNADRLELATLASMSFQFVIAKDSYRPGDRVVYFPIDSVIPGALAERLGVAGKLAGPTRDRVKTVRLRGQISQGIVGGLGVLPTATDGERLSGDDVTALVGVTKYEAPAIMGAAGDLVGLPALVAVYDIEGAERFASVVERHLLDEPVSITEKLEGSHFAASIDEHGEVAICQRRFRIRPIDGVEHVWHRVARESGALAALAPIASAACAAPGGASGALVPVTIRGEVVGPGVQGNLYRLPRPKLVVFEIETCGVPVAPGDFLALCVAHGLEHVPILAHGTTLRAWLGGRSVADASNGDSLFTTGVAREGVVIRPLVERRDPEFGRVIIKQRSPEYLARSDY